MEDGPEVDILEIWKCGDRREWHHCFVPMWEHYNRRGRNFPPLPSRIPPFLILSAHGPLRPRGCG